MTRRNLLQALAAAQVKPWRAAVSISFDDARLSQIDIGLPLLKKLDLKSTFYVLASNLNKRLVLLCYKRRLQQKGQHGNVRLKDRAINSLKVAMECGLCR